MIRIEVAPNPFDHEAMLDDGVREWALGDDALIDGERLPIKSLMEIYRTGLAMRTMEMLLIIVDLEIVGFALVAASEGWLEGHLLYILPARRGEGIVSGHFDPMLEIARNAGLRGFRMRSTSTAWAGVHGFTAEELLTQADGTVVYDYRRAA